MYVALIEITQCVLYMLLPNTQNIQQKYAAKGATIGSDLPVEFESDSISLQLPSEEDTRDDGWKIVTLFSPAVRKLKFAFAVLATACNLIAYSCCCIDC